MKKQTEKQTEKKLEFLKKIGLILIGLSSAAFSANTFAAMQICTDGGLTVYDPDCDDFWFSIGARVDIDEIVFSGSHRDRRHNFSTGGNIRRGLLAFTGGVGTDWTYNATIDFGRSTHRRRINRPLRHDTFSGHSFFEDAWIGYSGIDCTLIRIGQFTPLETLDGYGNYGITNGQMFLESALATRAFSVPSYINSSSTSLKGIGIIWQSALADLFTVGVTVYEPAQGAENVYHNRRRSDRVGAAARLTFSPIHDDCEAYHFGVLGRYQSLNSTRSSAFPFIGIYNNLFFTTPEVVPRNYVGVYDRANPNISPTIAGLPFHSTAGSPILVDAGPMRAKSYNHFAAEALGLWGPITLAGEYHYATVQRKPRDFGPIARRGIGNVHFHGCHIQGGYVFTGESREYDFETGTLGGICPCCDYGAWEVVARYSYLTLDNKNVEGGSENNVTLGLNWYVNSNIRFIFNYIRANINPTGFIAGVKDRNPLRRRLDIFALRAQIVF